ncbi:MAG: carboxypeptidase-like regulatory domain-containing protein, partial [Myxococcota bacterium]|nr:carboxypeptidase-like regulatory domain-containing protein [Myxococcota bacterium]
MASRLDDIRRRCRRVGFTVPVVVAVAAVGISGRATAPRPSPANTPAPRTAAPPQPAIDPPVAAPVARRPHLTARVIAHGAPLAGAEVSITDGSRPAFVTARSDRDGVVQFLDLAPGAYEIWATAPTAASP